MTVIRRISILEDEKRNAERLKRLMLEIRPSVAYIQPKEYRSREYLVHINAIEKVENHFNSKLKLKIKNSTDTDIFDQAFELRQSTTTAGKQTVTIAKFIGQEVTVQTVSEYSNYTRK